MSQQQHTKTTIHYPNLNTLEHQIRQAITNIENAKDDNTAATQYTQMINAIHNYFSQAHRLRDEYYKLRTTTIRQANIISEYQLDQITHTNHHHTTATNNIQLNLHTPPPETQPPPEKLLTIKTTTSIINLLAVEELDIQSSILHYKSGRQKAIASPSDLHKIKYHLNLHQSI